MPLPLLAIAGISALAAGAGAVGSSASTAKARKEETRVYNEAKNTLNSEYYRSPLSSVSNQALLKTMDERIRMQNDATKNRAVSGGATAENMLAAKQANNNTVSSTYSQLLMGEDARRQNIRAQEMALNQNHSLALQNNYRQNAQTWADWGQTSANAIMSLGMANELGLLNP